MMTTATGEIRKIETTKSSGRSSPTTYRSGGKAAVSATPGSSKTKAGSRTSSSEKISQHRRDEKPPPVLVVRRGSKVDRTNKTHSTIELDPSTDNSSRSVSERTSFMFKANCDSQDLAAALETFDLDVENFSSHTHSTSTNKRSFEDQHICIVRSDKLAFSGAGIRRHSRRKRHRQLGKDNTKIVILRQPSFKEQAAMAAAEAEAEAASKANKVLEEECAKQRSERQLSRANARGHERKSVSTSKPPTNNRRSVNQTVDDAKQEEGTPVRSNSVVRLGSSSGVMMFEDKSEDLDLWPLPLTAVS